MPMKVQEVYRTPNRWTKKKSSHHKIIKTLNIQNKEKILRAAKVTYKGRPTRIALDFSIKTLKDRRS